MPFDIFSACIYVCARTIALETLARAKDTLGNEQFLCKLLVITGQGVEQCGLATP